jgi:hypothetical protein
LTRHSSVLAVGVVVVPPLVDHMEVVVRPVR